MRTPGKPFLKLSAQMVNRLRGKGVDMGIKGKFLPGGPVIARLESEVFGAYDERYPDIDRRKAIFSWPGRREMQVIFDNNLPIWVIGQ